MMLRLLAALSTSAACLPQQFTELPAAGAVSRITIVDDGAKKIMFASGADEPFAFSKDEGSESKVNVLYFSCDLETMGLSRGEVELEPPDDVVARWSPLPQPVRSILVDPDQSPPFRDETLETRLFVPVDSCPEYELVTVEQGAVDGDVFWAFAEDTGTFVYGSRGGVTRVEVGPGGVVQKELLSDRYFAAGAATSTGVLVVQTDPLLAPRVLATSDFQSFADLGPIRRSQLYDIAEPEDGPAVVLHSDGHFSTFDGTGWNAGQPLCPDCSSTQHASIVGLEHNGVGLWAWTEQLEFIFRLEGGSVERIALPASETPVAFSAAGGPVVATRTGLLLSDPEPWETQDPGYLPTAVARVDRGLLVGESFGNLHYIAGRQDCDVGVIAARPELIVGSERRRLILGESSVGGLVVVRSHRVAEGPDLTVCSGE